MSSAKRKWGLVLGVGAVALAFFLPYGRDEPETAKIVSGRKKAEISAPILDRAPESAKEASSLQKMRADYNQMLLAGMKEIKTEDAGDALAMMVRTAAEPRSCRVGDFDIIKSLVSDANKKVFLLSVERLDGPADEKRGTRVNLLDIMRGDSLQFRLPKTAGAQEYGVFLCLDPSQSNSCKSKAALATKDWNAAINRKGLPDNILYFQLITSQGNKAYTIPIERWDAESLRALKGKISGWLKEPDESLQKAAQLMGKLGSLPAQSTSAGLDLPLPFRDPQCDIKASIPPRKKTGGG